MDNFVVFYKNKQGWHVSPEFNAPHKALAFMDELRNKQHLDAYTVHVGTIVANLPDLAFFEVEKQERG